MDWPQTPSLLCGGRTFTSTGHSVAASLQKNRFELRPVLQELFKSAEFYSERVIRTQIKGPVQFLVQSCKLLEITLPPRPVMQNALQQMGQVPLRRTT